MEENVPLPSTRSVGIKYGLILSVVSILFFLALTLSGANMAGPVRYLGYIIYAVFIFLAHKNFKDEGNSYLSYSQGIGIAFWMSLVSSVISSLFTYVYVKFVDAGFIEMMKETQLEQFQEKGMSEAQIEQAMKFSEMFMKPESLLLFGIVFGIIGIVVTALIVTIFTQKKNPEPAI